MTLALRAFVRRKSVILATLAAAAWTSGPADALAYDPQFTHRWITREAAKRLVEAYPGRYDELLEYADEVAAGAEEEDDPLFDGDSDPLTLRVMRHFLRPPDGAGLTMWGRTFPNSYEWAVLPNDTNVWGWDDGVAAWRRGDKRIAYRTLGHVVHLIQDATVPAHTHLDVHGPPAGDDYEEWCKTQIADEFTSALPVPPPGAPIPIFANAWDAWLATARASYARNLYPGDLSSTSGAEGVIKLMFPSLDYHWFFQDWRISDPPVGVLGRDFFEEEPGLFYFKNAEHAAAIDRASLDPMGGYAPNATGASMAELFARDLVPLAILHTAGVMKLYLDEVHALPVNPPPPPDEDPIAGPTAGGCAVAAPAAAGGPAGPLTLRPLALAALALAALAALTLLRRTPRTPRRT